MRVCPKCNFQAGDDMIFCPKDAARLVDEEDSVEIAMRSAKDPLVGHTIAGRYQILRRIGEGGMGVVYEAEHVALGKHVALKILREDFTRKSDLVERFKQEARSASIIGHENIIDVSDFGETETGSIFFAMELLRGEDLADVLQRETRLPLARVTRIVEQMCRALHAAHQKGIIHRDLKPENIFLVQKEERPDVVKVLDFGIAKMTTLDAEGRRLTKTGVVFGTPEYMSPEQARGQTLDLRVDVYAAGVMLYEMLTGQAPFTGESFMAILTQHLFSEPKRPSVVAPDAGIPPPVEQVILRAMAKDRDDRYSTMREMLDDLQRAVAGRELEGRASTQPVDLVRPSRGPQPSRSAPPAVGARTRRPSRRAPLVVAVAALLVLVLAGVGIYLWRSGGGAEPGDAGPPRPEIAAALVRPFDAALPPVPPPDAGVPPDAGPDEAEVDAGEDAGDEGGPDAGTEVEAEAGAGDDVEPEAESGAEPEAEPEAEPDTRSVRPPPEPRVIEVEFVTTPRGAVVSDRGRRICGPTPCRAEVQTRTTMRLHAEVDDYTGDENVRITDQTLRVSMTLRRPIRPPPRDAGAATPTDVWVLRTPDITP